MLVSFILPRNNELTSKKFGSHFPHIGVGLVLLESVFSCGIVDLLPSDPFVYIWHMSDPVLGSSVSPKQICSSAKLTLDVLFGGGGVGARLSAVLLGALPGMVIGHL